jgi:aldehyde dehydrogenase (NAD+)
MSNRAADAIASIAEQGFVIGADRVAATSGDVYVHHDPTTGRPQAEVRLGTAADITAAVDAARDALPAWRAMPPDERARILFRLSDLLDEHRDEAGGIWALEAGMPVSIMDAGSYTAGWTRYYAGWIDKLEGRVIPLNGPGLDYTLPEPYGVVGVIPPWNGSMMGMGQKAAPALAAGNTVVAKPPELAPFGAYRFAELALAAGLPPGVLNVVAGGAAAGEALVRDPRVAKVSFTGGGPTAVKVMEAAAGTLTPLALELGGKSANIVFADANLDVAVPASAYGFVALSGQGCALPTRLFVQSSVYDEVIDRLVEAVRHVPIGDPLERTTLVGPVINAAACRRILGVVDDARRAGAGTVLAGGGRVGGDLAAGYFVEPTVFGDVDHTSRLAREEIFGPVLSVFRFEDEDEVVTKANDSDYGLGAHLHTRDLARAHRMARRLDVGFVAVNGGAGLSPSAPFGGVKRSGFGREGGREGIDEYLRTKNVYLNV